MFCMPHLHAKRKLSKLKHAQARKVTKTPNVSWQRQKGAQPHLFTSSDGAPILSLASLWDRWRDPSNGEEILSCTLIVTEASEWMTPYHDRMPAVLAQAEIDRWLRGDMAASELHPAREERFNEYMVSSRLNRTGVGDDDPTIIEPAF